MPYTLSDDQILWDWLRPYELKGGDQVKGNLIYQQLERQHPRHTFQSWRDRYLKQLRGKPRPGGPPKEDQQQQQQQGTATKDKSTPVPNSTQRSSQQRSAIRNSRPEPVPRTESSQSRSQPSSPPEAGPARTDPSGTGSSGATRLARGPAQSRLNEIKRKRFEELPVPSFDTDDNPPKRQRHEPDVVSTPSQSNGHATQNKDNRRPAPEPTQSQFKTTSQFEEEANFAALNELPYPVVPEKNDSDEDADDDDNSEDPESWIEKHVRNGRKAEHAILALDCTSMNAGLADKVVAVLSQGREIPDDIPGVWTEDEDNTLLTSSETRKIEALLQKHGSKFYNERFKFLEERQKAYDVVMQEN